MSVLKEIKGIVLRGLKNETPEVKVATINLFEAIDTDLDAVNYDPMSETSIDEDTAKAVIESIMELNKALIELTEEEDIPSVPSIGDVTEKDLSDDDTDDDTK